jgi:hypothetical protein
VNGSVSSGCATATNLSTASGSPCPERTVTTPTTAATRTAAPAAASGTAARPATATAGTSLALTGSNSGQLTGIALAALLLGGLMVLASTRRRTAEG